MKTPGKCLPFALAAMAFVLTGCPNNEYIVELKPQAGAVERTLVFYRQDGTSEKTGGPKYATFDTNELAAILAVYPPQPATTNRSDRHEVRGQFSGALPSDVGGNGVYSNIVTSLGDVGFYSERFRGSDDLTGLAERRGKAADRLTDLLVGWSKAQLGRERGYDKLRKFLNDDFRRDLKNIAEYWWQGALADRYKTNGDEEFVARSVQYLYERGYFTLGEMPGLINDFAGDSSLMYPRVQRLLARKMGVPDDAPIPASLAFLANEGTMTNSFDKYLVGTPQYRALLAQWKLDKKKDPKAQKPTPDQVAGDAIDNLFELETGKLFDEKAPDHVIVRLFLPARPDYGNGRWDDALKQEIWDASLPTTNDLPVICYASWALPNEDFQKAHIGRVALTGENLMQYCIWRSTVKPEWGREWDSFLDNLQLGGGWWRAVDAFRFTGEPEQTNKDQKIPSSYPRELLQGALE